MPRGLLRNVIFLCSPPSIAMEDYSKSELSDCEMSFEEGEEEREGEQTEEQSEERAEEQIPRIVRRKSGRFSAAQVACLNAYFGLGMTGVGKDNLHLIHKAVKDTQLNASQVKGWIKQKSYKRRHARMKELPVRKKARLTPWQIFLKEYGESAEGKEAMLDGVGAFNKMASSAYRKADESERERLANAAASADDKTMTAHDVKRAGANTFKKLQSMFKDLELLGYRAVAVGFFEDDVLTAYTTNCACLISHSVVDYLRAIAIGANAPPPLVPAGELLSPGKQSGALPSSTPSVKPSGPSGKHSPPPPPQ